MRLKKQTGFTIVELMITVAIVGILSLFALPAYKNYTIRAQVSEGFTLASGTKPIITEFHATYGEFPLITDLNYVGPTGKYITQTSIADDGYIVTTFGNEANSRILGETLSLIPEIDGQTQNFKWHCESTIDPKYLPISCRASDTSNPGGNNGGHNFPDSTVYPGQTGIMGKEIFYTPDAKTKFPDLVNLIDNYNLLRSQYMSQNQAADDARAAFDQRYPDGLVIDGNNTPQSEIDAYFEASQAVSDIQRQAHDTFTTAYNLAQEFNILVDGKVPPNFSGKPTAEYYR